MYLKYGAMQMAVCNRSIAMIIGVPKEIKADEYRVGLIPSTTGELVTQGHNVAVETCAGEGAGIGDRAAALMAEFLPLGHSPAIETARRRTLQVGARLEQQILAAKPLAPPPSAQSIVVSVDGGHVKSIRSYQMRSFEVMLACVSNDQGEQQLFSSVPVEADRQ